MTDFDIWAADNEPEVHYSFTTYLVRLPRPAERSRDEMAFVYVEVDNYGMANIDRNRTVWFTDRLTDVDAGKSVNAICMEIYQWLVEWELCEWKRIGPEDVELFVTAKLVGEEKYQDLMVEG